MKKITKIFTGIWQLGEQSLLCKRLSSRRFKLAKAIDEGFDRRQKKVATGDIKNKAINLENKIIVSTTGVKKYKKEEFNIHLHRKTLQAVCHRTN